MDGYVVEDTAGCRRVVHQPVRHPSNPLIPGKAFLDYDDTEGLGTPSVIYDREQRLFRMWANSWRSYRDADHHYGLYYESEDGISWRSPELKLDQIEGVESPNVFFNQPGRSTSVAVTELPHKWRHKGRFLMTYHSDELGRDPATLRMPGGGMEVRIAFSKDGIHWKDQKEKLVIQLGPKSHLHMVKKR